MGFAALKQDYSVKGELTAQNITFQPTESFEKCGTEDPRIAYSPDNNAAAFEARAAAGKLDDPAIDGLYYLMYTAYDCNKAQLALATTTDPRNTASWVRHGPLWPGEKWSKSGAVLFRDQPPHYLIWGDSSLVNGMPSTNCGESHIVYTYFMVSLFTATWMCGYAVVVSLSCYFAGIVVVRCGGVPLVL